ncbi:MAG: DUF975 family protein [Clostridia bacterium]|nr:DUF975 family protein [Clostridia bacterium]
MTENQFQNNVFTPPVQKNAAYFRARARDLLKGKWGTAILIGFLALLLGAVITGGLNYNVDIDLSDLNDEVELVDAEYIQPDGQIMEWVWTLMLVLVGVSLVTTAAYSIFVASPLKLGYQRINLDLVDGEELEVKRLFSYFKINYLRSVRLNILHWLTTSAIVFVPVAILVVATLGVIRKVIEEIVVFNPETFDYTFLWQYLLWIGIFMAVISVTSVISMILSYTYRFSYMVMAEYPEMGALEAMRVSRNMMRGNKWRLFCLDISYIGWVILSAIFTFGIGMIVITPYREAALAAFYDDIAHRNAAKDAEFPSLDFDDYVVDEEPKQEEKAEEEITGEETTEEEPEVKKPSADQNTFMPFTAELEFPSLDLDDYVVDDEEDKKQ